MDSKKSKTLVINTLLLIFCVVVIALFCFGPTEEKEIVVLQTYNVAFDSDGGDSITSIEIKEGEVLTQPDTPVKEGYIFTGWTLNGEPYDFTEKITGDITLKATWEEKKPDVIYFTITFDTTGGSELNPITVESGGTALRPGDPVMDGYVFKEWQLNGVLYDFSQPVTSDITLTAIWEEVIVPEEPEEPEKPEEDDSVKYTVKFNSDGGSKVKDQTVKEGDKAKKPSSPTKKGYVFKSWQLDGKDYNFNSKVTKDITLKATWEKAKVTYTVKFDSAGGTAVASQTVAENGKASTPSVPKKTGYLFNGWYYNGKEYNFNSVVTSNITLKAQWVIVKYTIKFYDGSNMCGSTSVNYNSSISLPSSCSSLSKVGFTTSWATKAGVALNKAKATSDMDFYIKYTKKSYTVKAVADVESGTGTVFGYNLTIGGLASNEKVSSVTLYYTRSGGNVSSKPLAFKNGAWSVDKPSMWTSATKVEFKLSGSDETFVVNV